MSEKHSANFRDITGQKFKMLTAVKFVETRCVKNKYITYWLFNCECGKEIIKISRDVVSGKAGSCGCYLKRTGNKNFSWKGKGEISSRLWSRIKNGAKKREFSFNITIDYAWELFLKQNRECALSGLPLRFGNHSNDKNSNASLDRIDNLKGYEMDNIQWIHKDINFMKQDYSEPYFIDICKKISDYNSEK